ncbi:uncharacterized protein N7498_010719 [Penicillium cinerascens]|uniref:SAP domain-containing protein n=1 Tax=Penicillium cinerascens TaxID=70096 RepID=A0A9W9J8H7_9EURO|nr:uncharacterized protein N7498_010719 [Penicillium cinerascens]KAJ5191734.1 hypothetical protein N7498_010719 [Penicillium cinerascens]
MADYSSLKVADLKAELKKRGIPQTGLRLKQHFIDKLVEEDAKAQTRDTAPEVGAAETKAADTEAVEPKVQPKPTSDTSPQAQELQPEQPPPEEPKHPEAPTTQDTHPSRAALTSDKAHEEVQEKTKFAPELATDNGEPAENEKLVAAARSQPSEEVNKAAAESESVEQAPGIADQTDRADFAISAELPAPLVSEAITELSTPLPLEEDLEDKRKRKRRSQSPVPTPEAVANKKARAREESSLAPSQEDQESIPREEETKDAQGQKSPEDQKKEPSVPAKDARFRGLFAPTAAQSSALDVIMEDADVEPARHPATASLYIDGLMRPLQPPALRKHLISVASAPGSSPNPDVVREFFLDSIKTHCFVQFSDITAASRVRSTLHGKVWPDERNRKNLWVDFIPDEKVQEWIRTEEASRDRAGPPVRWEVQYETTDNGAITTLAEAGLNSRAAPSRTREPGFNRTPPLGPRGSHGQIERASNAPPPSRPGQGFKPLDELFKSTTAKPKLYYLPVARPIADKRLDQFDELLRKGSFPRRGGDEMRRITFEDEDYFVDVGPEYGAMAMQRRQERGGRGRGRGRRP